MKTETALISEVKRDEAGRFIVPPKSPGRPRGARNKLGEAFIADLFASWELNGMVAIQKVFDEKPEQYLKVVASVIPQEVRHTVEDYDDLDDDALAGEFLRVAGVVQARTLTRRRDREAPQIEGSERQSN